MKYLIRIFLAVLFIPVYIGMCGCLLITIVDNSSERNDQSMLKQSVHFHSDTLYVLTPNGIEKYIEHRGENIIVIDTLNSAE